MTTVKKKSKKSAKVVEEQFKDNVLEVFNAIIRQVGAVPLDPMGDAPEAIDLLITFPDHCCGCKITITTAVLDNTVYGGKFQRCKLVATMELATSVFLDNKFDLHMLHKTMELAEDALFLIDWQFHDVVIYKEMK